VLLGNEGIDNDGDGRVNEDGDGFYDPNRDWPRQWQPNYVQGGAYRYPFSIGENRLVGEFVLDHPNIAGAQSYHNTGGMILRGPGNSDDEYSAADVAVYDAIAAKGELMLPFYDYLVCSTGLYNVYGGEFDWFFGMRGIFSFTNELFTRENYFRRGMEDRQRGRARLRQAAPAGPRNRSLARSRPSPVRSDRSGRKAQAVGTSTAVVPAGGRVPSEHGLHALPRRPDAPSGDPVGRREAPGRQTGGGDGHDHQREGDPDPCRCGREEQDHAARRGVHQRPGLKVVAALRSSEPFFQNAEEQEYHPEKVRISNIPGMGAVYVRWLVEGAGPYTINVQSVKGGSAQVRKE
jgi:hypothetical protein